MFASELPFVVAFFSDWLTKWRELFKPIAQRSNAKQQQQQQQH